MKKKIFSAILVLLALLVVASCTTFKLSGLQVTTQIPSYDVVGEFDITVKVTEFLGAPGGANLGNVTADKMDAPIYDAIQREIQKYTGDAAVNVEIEYLASFTNILVSGVTLGIVAPARARVTGTIVKYDN